MSRSLPHILLIATGALLLSAPAGAKPLAPVAQPTWTRSLGKDAGTTALVQTGAVVVAATWNSQLAGLDGATGKVLWRQKNKKVAGTQLNLVVGGGRVVTGLENGNMLSGLDPKTGKTAWARDFGGPIGSVMACPGHRLVAATFRGRLPDGSSSLVAQAFDPTSGAPLWQVPATGHLMGAGAGHLFTALPSGTGRLNAGIAGINCATGAPVTLPRPTRKFSQFLTAGEGHVVTSHFEFQFKKEIVCVTALDGGAQTCFDAKFGGTPKHNVSGALVKDGAVYVSTAHQMAHNLDPSPDGWVFRYDLESKAITAKSAALLSGGLFVDAGGQILTGFGTTGIDDFGYTFDPNTLKVTAAVALQKAPRAVAANATHAFIGAYNGTITAFELPAAGAAPKAEKVVKAQPISVGTAPSLGWSLHRVIDAHPKKARSSGSMSAGHVYDVLFLDDERFAIGGSDDRVTVWAVDGRRRVWRSPRLAKDVQRLAKCKDRIAAYTYSGNIFTFAPRGRLWRRKTKISNGFGWAFGMASNCAVVADDFDGNFKIYKPDSAKVAAEMTAKGTFDRRWVRVTGEQMVVSRPSKLEVINVVDLREGPSAEREIPTPMTKHGARMSQARMAGDRLLVEYCNDSQCVVELSGGKADPQTLTFDVKGDGWSPTVGSSIEISPDGKTMVFFRRGLDLLLVDLKTDKRQPLNDIAGVDRQRDEVINPAFSPDGKWLAIGAHPKTYQVTLLKRD